MTYEVKYDLVKINEYQQEFVLKTFTKQEDALEYLFNIYKTETIQKRCRFGITERFISNGLEFETEIKNLFVVKKIDRKILDNEPSNIEVHMLFNG